MTRTSRSTIALLVALLIPLCLLYLTVLDWLARDPGLLPLGALDAAVLVTQVARALVVIAVPRFRRAGLFATCLVFVPDLLIAATLATFSSVAGDPALVAVSRQLFGAWAPSFLVAFLPLATYKVASKIRGGRAPLSETLPFFAFVFICLSVFVSAMYSPETTGPGLSGVSDALFAAVFGRQPASSGPVLLSITGTMLTVAMVVYGLSQGDEAPPMRSLLPTLAILGLAVTVGWALVISSLTQSSTLAFAVPALVLIAAIWGITRAS